MSRVLLLACLGALVSCGPTDLRTADAGSCDGLQGQNRWPWTPELAPVVASTGFDVGDTAPDFQLLDQFGEPVCLWQFSGKVVLIDASALWCGPCRLIAEHARCVADSFDGELVYLTFIGQDYEFQPADFPDNTSWADDFDLSDGSLTPVLVDPGRVFANNEWAVNFPSFLLLDRDMTVLAKGEQASTEKVMRDEAEEILGPPSLECDSGSVEE